MNGRVFTRGSELTYVAEQPMAVLSWLHHEGSRIPGVCVNLNPGKLRRGALRRVFLYSEVTFDPRFRLK